MKSASSLLRDFKGYTKEDLKEIGESVGPLVSDKSLQQLGEDVLAQIKEVYNYGRSREHKKPPAQPTTYSQIERATNRLLKLLKVEPAGAPHAAPHIRDTMLAQGRDWALEWYESVKREKWEQLRLDAMAKNLPQDEMQKLVFQSERVFNKNMKELETRRRSHGSWPASNEIETRENADGSTTIVAYGEAEAFRIAVEGVQRLRTWAELATNVQQVGEYTGTEGVQRKEKAMLIARLPRIYEEYFGKKFGVSKPKPNEGQEVGGTNEVGGPGVRFIQACLAPLGISMTGFAIEKAWDTMRTDKTSDMGNSTSNL